MKNPAGFIPKPSAQDISGRMQYAPTRVHQKPGGFHISPSGYTKNAPDFTHPNRDMPKTRPVLGANPCRRIFGGVCFCTLHGYVKNLSGFIFPHTDTPKTCPVLDPNLWRGTFWGVCFCALHGYVKNLSGFIFPHTDTPKTRPILYPNLRRRTFRGVCFCAPTRVCAKFGGFHISAHRYTKNPSGFRPKPSSQDIWGLCNMPLHGYAQNLAGFIFPHMYPPKTHLISPFPIRIRPKPA